MGIAQAMKITPALCLMSAITIGAIAHRATAAPPPVLPLAGLAYQAPLAAGDSRGTIVAFASTSAASHVREIAFVPVDALACDPTDYADLEIVDVDAAGMAGPALYSGTTHCIGSGDWSAGVAAFVVSLDYDLPRGHTLAALWQQSGAGVAVPGGAWRVE